MMTGLSGDTPDALNFAVRAWGGTYSKVQQRMEARNATVRFPVRRPFTIVDTLLFCSKRFER
jgi:hypothetical protein